VAFSLYQVTLASSRSLQDKMLEERQDARRLEDRPSACKRKRQLPLFARSFRVEKAETTLLITYRSQESTSNHGGLSFDGVRSISGGRGCINPFFPHSAFVLLYSSFPIPDVDRLGLGTCTWKKNVKEYLLDQRYYSYESLFLRGRVFGFESSRHTSIGSNVVLESVFILENKIRVFYSVFLRFGCDSNKESMKESHNTINWRGL